LFRVCNPLRFNLNPARASKHSSSYPLSSSSLALNLPEAMDQVDFNAPHSMGTTIIGVTFNGGVVLGADSRTSTGTLIRKP
jgi:20S proteasome alpha/beta subunit